MDLTQQTEPKFMVVIGTSAGGIGALEDLIMQLQPGLDAAFLLYYIPHVRA